MNFTNGGKNLCVNTNTVIIIPNTVENVIFYNDYNQPTVLPEGIKNVVFGTYFNQPIHIPTSIKSIAFDVKFNQDLILPEGLEDLSIDGEFEKNLILPSTLKTLFLRYKFNSPLILPEGLKEIAIEGRFNQPIIIPNSVKKCYINKKLIIRNFNSSVLNYCYYFSDKNNEIIDILNTKDYKATQNDLYCAIARGNNDILEALLSCGAKYDNKALSIACACKNSYIINIIKEKLNIDKLNLADQSFLNSKQKIHHIVDCVELNNMTDNELYEHLIKNKIIYISEIKKFI